MPKGLNKCEFIGYLGKDPEMKYTPNGVAVTTFSIAVSESWKDKDGNAQEKTEWINIVAWRKLAEICGEWLKKGKRVYLEGKMQTRTYDKDGIKHYVTEVVIDDMIMLDSATPRAAAEPSAPPAEPSGDDKDLPF